MSDAWWTFLWWVMFILTIALGIVFNNMVVLAVMAVPLIVLHLWLALKATA